MALKLIKFGRGGSVACFLDKFQGLDHNEIALKLIEAGAGVSLADNLYKFQGLDHNEIALKLIEVGKVDSVVHYLHKFKELNDETALKLIEFGKAFYVAENLERFKGLNNEVALKLIESGFSFSVAQNLEKFQGLDHEEIALKLIEAGKSLVVAGNINLFHDLDKNIGQNLVDNLINNYEKYDSDGDGGSANSSVLRANNYYSPVLDRVLVKAEELFGDFFNINSYKILKKISENDQETISQLGLKNGGEDGLREIQEKLRDFKAEMLQENFNPEVLIQDSGATLLTPFFKASIRYEDSDWGNHDNSGLTDTIKKYLELKEGGKLKPLNPEFKPSEYLDVKRVDDEAREKYVFNEHFLNRFKTLVGSIKEVKKLYLEKFPLTQLVNHIEEKKVKLLEELRQKSASMPNPKAQEAINSKIKGLESINIRDVKSFQDNFAVLVRNKEFSEDLREVVFLMGFAKNRQALNYDLDKINLEKPELEDISWTLNFVDHISNQETMSQYFTDNNASKLFNEITSTQAIQEEMAIFQNQGDDKGGTTKIQFISTRGILTEFSGHIADACWASRYESILASYPNFTSVVIRQNPETKHERLAGAFMLIETTSEAGDDLLVIRGLNPIENLINSVSVSDFYNKVKDYAQELAQKTDRKLAIVMDDYCGGSSTNRPVLYKYLDALDLEGVELNPGKDTTFNGYNIVDNVRLID